MTFGEHLEELRRVLVRALLGVAVGTAIGLMVATQVVAFLTGPLERSMRKYEQNLSMRRLAEERGWLSPDLKPWLTENSRAPQTVMVDPEQLFDAMAPFVSEPEQQARQPIRFAEQLAPEQIHSICRQLMAEQSEVDLDQRARLRAVREGLLADEWQLVEQAAGRESLSWRESRPLGTALNALCARTELFERPEFQAFFENPYWFVQFLFGMSRDQQLQELLQQHRREPTVETQRGLNELLLAATFAREFATMRRPLVPLEIWTDIDVRPQSLAATDGFMIWMKAGLITGIFVSSPWVFYQLWSFVGAGLYPTEKRYVHIYLPISLLLFFSGIAMAFFFVFDPVLSFLFSFNAQMGIALQPRINEWLSFVLFLPLGFGIAFQLPLVMLFLFRLGIVSIEQYLSKWRIAVMVIFVIAMLLTPAEPISMMLLAAPLTVLYFLGIGLCHWLPSRRRA